MDTNRPFVIGRNETKVKNYTVLEFTMCVLLMFGATVGIAEENRIQHDGEQGDSADFKVRVFYPASAGIESQLQESVASVSSPDFEVDYQGVSDSNWNTDALGSLLVSAQQSDPVSGFFLACRAEGLDEIGRVFRAKFPKIPFVDTFSPSLMAANIISYRYAVFAGSEQDAYLAMDYINALGITSHVRLGAGPTPYDASLMVGYDDFEFTEDKNLVVSELIAFGELYTGSDHTSQIVTNIEAIALVGCRGFLDVGVASAAQSELAAAKIPLQVINPIKASIGLLYSLVRNKVWISSS